MKKIYFLLLTLLISTASIGQDLVLTGVFDGPFSGGVPKLIEIYVINDIPDLSIYGVESANNGTPAAGVEYNFPAEAKTAGTFIYLAYEGSTADALNTYFGVSATYLDNVANNNGDDAILLYQNTTVIDVFGAVGTDGTGEPWETLDGWAYRNDETGPDGSTFTIGNWSFSGINATDGCTTNATCASIYPIGTYSAPLSIDENSINNFKIYPNPTSLGYVNINSSTNSPFQVGVFDILGKQVLNQTVSNSRLNVSTLKSGIYIMKISQNNAVVTKKLVIK